ncbi:MAG TPA: YcfL family protein [Deltaproteobacteria bacterium]|nr:YcfL family protein [Deltaproteobacteria bacterium]HPR54264.1 YcfL family protein [Deltaproteobacteria bacterium]HXK45824.1 YcfL family protein [Deltaproteobacteria bacterium]
MRRHGAYLVLLVVLVLACAGTAPNILYVQAGPAGVSSRQLEINDRFIERTVGFGDISISPLDSTGQFETQVILTNLSDRDVAFEYRFMWYDARGFELSNVTSWLPGILGAKESKGFRSVTPAAGASSFKLMVRKPHPVTPTGS